MDPVVRELTTKDIPSCKALWADRFHDSGPLLDVVFSESFFPDLSCGLFLGNELISTVYGQPFPVRFGSVTRTGLFLSGVSTKKGYEKRGYMHRCLEAVERIAVTEGYPFLMLSPAKERVYLSWGFSTILRLKELTVHTEGIAVPCSATDEELLDCFNRSGDLYSLYPVRTLRDMIRSRKEQTASGSDLFVVRDTEGSVSAYGFVCDAFCEEWSAVSKDFLQALLESLPDGTVIRVPALHARKAHTMWKPLEEDLRLPGKGPYMIQDMY